MAGILGIVGEGNADELKSMGRRMSYRGAHLVTFNPVPGVLLGEISHEAAVCNGESALALDVNGALYPGNHSTGKSPATASENARQLLERDLRQHGIAALRDVSGHFALAFWDAATKTVTLAADRQGFKTLYYIELPGRIAFASDYKGLLALRDCPAELDRDVLQTYLLLFSCPTDRSLLKGVKPITQATAVQIRDGRVSATRFWKPQRRRTELTFAKSARALRTALESALGRQLEGQDRAGLLLSGGLDSAALLALVRHVRPDLQVATFTIGHSASDPDIRGARKVAAYFGAEHQEHFYPLEALPTELPRMVWQTEDLSGREESLLQPAITAIAARSERVILAGHGADAVFGGMPRHRILWMRDRAPPPLRGALCELYVYTRYKRMPRSWLGRQLVMRAYRGDLPAPPQVIDSNPIGEVAGCKSLDRYMEEHMSPSSGFLHDEPVLAEAGTAMLIPFLDPAVTELALNCPGSYHIGLREQKRLLRAAVADLLPPDILASRKTIQRLKHDDSLSNAFDKIAKDLDLARSLADRKLIASNYVWSLGARLTEGLISPERMHSLWGLICAELWMRQFIDRRGQPINTPDASTR